VPELPQVSIVIVNWNSAEFVRRCIDSIRRDTGDLAYEIIVVDNASYDGCGPMLQQHCPDAIYIQSDRNRGFAKANNLGFEASRGESLLFLNPDTEVIGPAIVQLHCALQQLPGAGAVGAKLLNADGSVQASCIQSFPTVINQVLDFEYLRRKWPESELWGMAALHRPTASVAQVEVISGACLMVRREVFQRVGRFNENYFMYAEDADLCYQVRCAGWKNYYVPDATVVHFGGSSSRQAASSFSAVMMRESIWQFLRRTRGAYAGIFYRWAMALAAIFRLGLLGVLMPIQAVRRPARIFPSPIRKWWAILPWSVHRQEQIRDCYRAASSGLKRR
jgi:N-acetylglucosaminyl-diphospho-decaprenol L-rhamnosyltransferase